jgi:hypothetical protein
MRFWTFLVAAVIAATISTAAAEPIPWQHPLYLPGDGYWAGRVSVTVANDGDFPLEGRPVVVPIGDAAGQLPLAGSRAESIRLVDAAGVELLYGLAGPNDDPITAGPLPEGSSLVLPAVCEPHAKATYFVYFDNPGAGEVPDSLQAKTGPVNNVTLHRIEPGRITVRVGSPERLALAEIGGVSPWQTATPNGAAARWEHRAVARLFHYSDEPAHETLVQIDGSMLAARMRGRINWDSVLVTDAGRPVKHSLCGEKILLAADLPARSARTYCVYFSDDPTIRVSGDSDYAQLLASRANLVNNPGFESGDPEPDGWTHSPAGNDDGVTFAVVAPEHETLGQRCVRMQVSHDAAKSWRGWRKTVPVRPGGSYLFAAWVRTEDVRDGEVRLHAHCLTAARSLSKENAYRSVGPGIQGTTGWTFMSGTLEMPADAGLLDLHLTMDATGTVWHDGALVAEVAPAEIVRLEGMPMAGSAELAVWKVPAVEKVLEDTPAPGQTAPAEISLARNEQEPLQLAVRGGRGVSGVEVTVEPPVSPGGVRLDDVRVGVVGYVPIDHATSYYQSDAPTWVRKFPTQPGSCDGWPGMWPDPLLPVATFDLEPNATRSAWITVTAGPNAVPGDYRGSVRLQSAGRTLAEVPFGVHVWDFALPDEKHVAAIYDVRYGRGDGLWQRPLDEMYPEIVELMAHNRLSPDAIRPEPRIGYRDGRVEADFSEFDKAAEWYFDELGIPYSYTPQLFYLFGWGHPPKTMFGERPYPGDPPYTGADRSRLRPEYERAYQACLRVFWDHVKEKGWDKRFILYISDEPHYSHPEIVAQMKALCGMIHEVDPAIPIYSSTWGHLPDWDDSLDVWGIGHYGRVPVDEMNAIRRSGSRIWFTTDGQMCTDTPYLAVERLLPHYCFQYGAEAYEFWGVSWLTYNPYQFGWHAYIHQSSEPGKYYWVRYPNGDGFLLYPAGGCPNLRAGDCPDFRAGDCPDFRAGDCPDFRAGDCPDFRAAKMGLSPLADQHAAPVTSIRFEQAREGAEDFEYLYLLRALVEKAKQSGRDVAQAEAALRDASTLVEIPNPGGRWSSKILPDPMAVYQVRRRLAEAIEGLK